MENSRQNHLAEEGSSRALPSLIKAITANEVAGFDSVEEHHDLNRRLKSTLVHPLSTSIFGIEAAAMENENDLSKPQRTHSVSISMPPSPVAAYLQNTNRVLFRDEETVLGNDNPDSAAPVSPQTKQAKFYSQPMPKGCALNEAITSGTSSKLPVRNPRIDKLKDKRFDSFKTWSGRLERQLSNLRGKHHEESEQVPLPQHHAEIENLPVDRYFDALEGPELDTLRASEEILLPEDKKWPFLLRFPISSFGICLGVSSQAIMWKALASSASTKFLHVSPDVNLVLWLISIALVLIVTIIYALKVIFYFEAVRREYYHPIRVNFFFAPWIALLFLALGVPPSISQSLHASLWYILMTPIFCLELKIYGQWMSGGQRRLSKVANPSNHLSIVGNFVGALLGATMGLKEGPIFFFAVGLAHYTVLFVTLYQRLPTNETLPKELHPVFFLFVAAPSVASMAWARIQGSFDYGSRIAYFIALFLYFSLAVRVNFFRGFRFSLAWWAYTFPMTGAAIATIRYSDVATSTVSKLLTIVLCIVATLIVSALLVTTIIHAFVLQDLFPNDIAIAISKRRPKTTRRWYHRRSGSSDTKVEGYLKYSNSDSKDIEGSTNSSDKQEMSGSLHKKVERHHLTTLQNRENSMCFCEVFTTLIKGGALCSSESSWELDL
ncbi:UNVERIFIED_CONTAM: S-type anion channel SLAH3 [Sesamum radiatum]|uniref:S-type anion channel SLAH3 n=1 Tax=Sesamum radiatum TaxID=300843 RepID=A0AAW2KD07_SESRA